MLTQYERELVIEGIRLYAWWKDGEQYVGSTGKLLSEAMADVLQGRDDPFVNPQYKTIIQDAIETITLYIRRNNAPNQVTKALEDLKVLTIGVEE